MKKYSYAFSIALISIFALSGCTTLQGLFNSNGDNPCLGKSATTMDSPCGPLEPINLRGPYEYPASFSADV